MYQIDNQSRNPVYEQIIAQVERYVLSGVLKGGDQIPSVRQMSLQIKLNPNTVQKAYNELDRKKVIYTVSGVGCFISDNAAKLLRAERREKIADLKPVISDFAISGIKKEEIIALIDSVYSEERKV